MEKDKENANKLLSIKAQKQRHIFGFRASETSPKNLCFAQKLSGFFGCYLFDFGIKRIQTEHKIVELFFCKFSSLLCCAGPGQGVGFETLIEQENPSPIQSSPLILSERLPQKRNRVPFSNGFW